MNIGNPHELTVRQVAERIKDITGSDSPIEFVDAMVDDPQRRCPDISLARRRPGLGAEDRRGRRPASHRGVVSARAAALSSDALGFSRQSFINDFAG